MLRTNAHRPRNKKRRLDVVIYFFFLGDAAFFAFAAAAAGALAVFGFGALGFLVGPALLDFLAFDGVLTLVAAAAGFAFLSAAAAAAAFLAAAAVGFLSPAVAAFFGDFGDFFTAFGFSAVTFFDAVAVVLFLALVTTFFLSPEACLEAPEAAAANLNEPEAPLPFVCTKPPDATADFRYFLIKGATFSASTL